ncbi:trypsin-like peptidase domain-containing protein [Patescibacteria group bacterium]|nr:trypsin-like peptidase domain-containing protein [Patescibacteria group bacterium]
MYCPQCGKAVLNNSKFCEFCGKSIERIPNIGGQNVQNTATTTQTPLSKEYSQYTHLGGFWIRVAAFTVDYLIVFILASIVLGILSFYIQNDFIGYIFFALTFVLYFTLAESTYSTTFGKVLWGLKVIDAKKRSRLSFAKALGRTLLYYISALFFGLGFIMVAFDDNKQGLHDKIAKTYVLRKDKRFLIPIIVNSIIYSIVGLIVVLAFTLGPYSYLPEEDAQRLESLDQFLTTQPENFDSLLISANYGNNDYSIEISEGEKDKTSEEIVGDQGDAVLLVKTDLAFGSGFIIHSDGVIVTNYHVIEGAKKVAVSLTNKDMYVVTKVIDYDKEKDIVILKINKQDLPTVDIGDSNNLKSGEKVTVIGNPVGLQNSVSQGIVSALDREYQGANYIQIDAPISGGSSGGPIFDDKGRVVAISTLILIGGQNLNFGVRINEIFNLEFGNIVKVE